MSSVFRTDVFTRMFYVALLLGTMALCGCIEEKKTTITFNADGTVRYDLDLVVPRATMQTVLLQQARLSAIRAARAGKPVAPAASAAPEVTEEAVRTGAAKFIRQQSGSYEKEKDTFLALTAVTIDETMVRLSLSGAYPTFQRFLAHQQRSLDWNAFETIEAQPGTDGTLVVHLVPDTDGGDISALPKHAKSLSVRFVFPGGVRESTLPETDGNATFITIGKDDPKRAERLDAFASGEIRIVAEAPGFPESAAMQVQEDLMPMVEDNRNPFDTLPVVPAQPGAHRIQALGTVLRRATLFAQAQPYTEGSTEHIDMRSGLTVTAQLIAPAQRRILWMREPITLISAIDEQGRAIGMRKDGGRSYSTNRMQDRSRPVVIQAELQTPAPDAHAVERLELKTDIVTCEGFRSKSISVNEPGKAMDIADVLPGATVTIRKFDQSSEHPRMLQATCTIVAVGPAAVKQLLFECKVANNESVSGFAAGDATVTKDGVSTRTLSLNLHTFIQDDSGAPVTPMIEVQLPINIRKESVNYVLEGVDFY